MWGGGCMFIYSCFTRRISFQIKFKLSVWKVCREQRECMNYFMVGWHLYDFLCTRCTLKFDVLWEQRIIYEITSKLYDWTENILFTQSVPNFQFVSCDCFAPRMQEIIKYGTRPKIMSCNRLLKTGLNTVVLPTLFNVVNNMVQHCYTWLRARFSVNNFFNIVDNN